MPSHWEIKKWQTSESGTKVIIRLVRDVGRLDSRLDAIAAYSYAPTYQRIYCKTWKTDYTFIVPSKYCSFKRFLCLNFIDSLKACVKAYKSPRYSQNIHSRCCWLENLSGLRNFRLEVVFLLQPELCVVNPKLSCFEVIDIWFAFFSWEKCNINKVHLGIQTLILAQDMLAVPDRRDSTSHFHRINSTARRRAVTAPNNASER